MQKIKKIICLLMLILVLPISLTACGDGGDNTNDGTNTSSVISLAKAKTIIVKALEINNVQTQSRAVPLEENGNRDVLEKLGKFSLLENFYSVKIDDESTKDWETTTAEYEYSNGQYQKQLLTSQAGTIASTTPTSVIKVYAPDTSITFWQKDGIVDCGNEYSMPNNFNRYLTALFTDVAFANVYKGDVNKNLKQDGFDLVLSADVHGFMFLYYSLSMPNFTEEAFETIFNAYKAQLDEAPAGSREVEKYEVVIHFDKDEQIVGAVVTFSWLQPQQEYPDSAVEYWQTYVKLSLNLSTTEIVEPAWVSEYEAQ